MRIIAITVAFAIVASIASLFLTWNFDRSVTFHFDENPLWESDSSPKRNALTDKLKSIGLSFHSGLGAEADPSGIAFCDKASDEYWIVTYSQEDHQLHLLAWIIGLNWTGHLSSEKRFKQIEDSIKQFTAPSH